MNQEYDTQYMWLVLMLVIVGAITAMVFVMINNFDANDIRSDDSDIEEMIANVDNEEYLSPIEIKQIQENLIPRCKASQVCTKIISQYDYIEIRTESIRYTIHIRDGDIVQVLENSDITPDEVIYTSNKKIKEVYELSMNGANHTEIIPIMRSDIPVSMYMKALDAVID